ncbi:MAG: alpha/beta fold hydrolase [Deltaproteobacteria bacterium]|nr:alpha/beta fold hydrolase [Deltaproteobacteria bacterium]
MKVTQHTGGPVSIAYDIEGRGPLVVFLHGIGGNRTNWGKQLEEFSPQFCAVAWDARGYGASADPPVTLQFSDYANDLRRLLDHLKAEKAHLVGLSMGGMIIQDFYARYPDQVATLVLVDTSPGFGTAPEEVKKDFLARRLEPLERGLKPADFAPSLVEVLVAPGAAPPVREQLRASLAMLRPEPYKQALKAIVTTDFRAVLPKISVPVLVIVGEEDQVTTPATAEYLAKNIPSAEKVVIAKAGHLTNLEQPEAFNSALRTFLSKHADRASRVSAV